MIKAAKLLQASCKNRINYGKTKQQKQGYKGMLSKAQ